MRPRLHPDAENHLGGDSAVIERPHLGHGGPSADAPLAARVGARHEPNVPERLTKRLRISLGNARIQAEAIVTLTMTELDCWQTSLAYDGTGHASVGHLDEHSALMHAARWLRARCDLQRGDVAVVQIRAAA